jgi:hypothetical protein
MKPIKVLAGTASLLTLIGIGYYGCLKSVERMYGVSIGLITSGILTQTMKNGVATKSPIRTSLGTSNSKRRRKILKSLRPRANFFH